MGASLPPRTGVDKKHRIWITTLKLAQMTHTHHPDPDCLTIMWKQKTYLLYQSSLNDQGNAGLNAKLTVTFTLISPWAARGSAITLLSGSYQGKALDCIVIIRQLYLPAVASLLSIHMYNSLPRLWEESKMLRVKARFSHRVNHRAQDRDLLLHSPPLPNSWQTYTVGLVAGSQSCLPHPVRWAKPSLSKFGGKKKSHLPL